MQSFEQDVTVSWKPYQIDPGTAEEGEDFEAYNVRRWGSSAWTRSLKSDGAKDGVPFRNWQWWPHSSRAHQWIQYAIEKHGLSDDTDRLNYVLFQALYEHGENISLVDTLVKLGEKEFPGCITEDLRDYLENQKGKMKVENDIMEGRRKYNIRGVPFFVVDSENGEQPYTFSGAQPVSTFLKLFEELSS